MSYSSADDVKQHLISMGVDPNVANDEAGYLYASYSDPGENLDQVIQNSLPSYLTRSNRPTASNGGVGGSADPDGDGVAGTPPAPVPNPAPAPTVYPRGADLSPEMQAQIADAIRNMNAQPGVDVSGITPGTLPTIDVGGENLSPAIDETLLQAMEGQDPLNLQGYLTNFLSSTAGGGINSERFLQRKNLAREELNKGQQGALADLRAVLADRGLLGEPGAPQGMEQGATVRAFEPLQQAYLKNLRESYVSESQQADDLEVNALTQATGWTRDQAASKLAGARTAQERQQMMSNIALKQLDQSIEWNRFLAEFGLKREQVQEEMRMGRIEAVQNLLQMFVLLTQQSRGGYIGAQ